jgi:putative peptide zinc metalloprotease protein
MKRLVLLLAAGLALAAPAPAAAQGLGGVQRLGDAVAINTRDGSSIFRLAFHIVRTSQDVVDDTNVAVAFASCAECQTVAISIQAILIFSDPSVVTATNTATGVNYQCYLCDTAALAYQWLFTTGGPVHFTAEGNRKIAEIRRKLQALRDSGLSGAELQAAVDALMADLEAVLKNEVVPAGQAPEVPAGAGPPPPLETTPEPTETTATTETTTETTETTETTTTTP